ncbi:MAG: aromatic amino acid ammonia-lyase [Synergistales bacterium]|nr:aromatic amino acid ammonia-lyase [Synergistales bacterium]
MRKVVLTGKDLTIEEVVAVARENAQVSVAGECREEIRGVRDYIEEHWIRPDAPPTYGFNTGLGKLKDYTIDMEQNDQFQHNIVMSHCGCVGEPAGEDVVRATMLVRINAFCQGVSGLRLEVIDRLAEMLNRGVHPVIPLLGSVGASGDLAPLAHMTSVLIGHDRAEAFYRGERMAAPEALRRAGIAPVRFQLKAKDALALINGTTMFAGMAALACHDALELARQADVATALSLEAVRGELAAFDPRIQKVRRHPGQARVAENVRTLTAESTRTTEEARKVHLADDLMHPGPYKPRVQDLYSLRCMPQVHGSVRDNLDYVWQTIERELNAATDNPLVFRTESGEELEFLSGGNFHGEPIAFAMDLLTVSLAELGNISERRTFSLTDPALSYGLPPMLSGSPTGLNYGYGIIACSASALASENKTLCFPATADTISTKAGQEDHVSMAPWATRKAVMVERNLEKMLGIEFLLAAEAVTLTEPELGRFRLGKGTQAVFDRIRADVEGTSADSYMPDQSGPLVSLVERREMLKAAEWAVGLLQ